MWYAATIVGVPPAEPLTVADLKAWAIIDHDDDDGVVTNLTASARQYVERTCNIRLAAQDIVMSCDGVADLARLREGPIRAITSIKYRDAAGAEQTVPAETYELRSWSDGMESAVVLQSGKAWPARQPGSRLEIEAVAGFAAVPTDILHAMALWAAAQLKEREDQARADLTSVDALLMNYRRGA